MPADQSTESANTIPETAESEFAEPNPTPETTETPATPEVAATPAETPAPTHPEPLIAAAREAGLSERTIAKLDTDALYEVLVNQHRKLSEVASQPRRRDEEEERPRRPVAPAADEYEAEFAEIEQEVNPRLVSIQRKLANELRDLKAREAERLENDRKRRYVEVTDAADEAIDSLGKSIEQKFTNEQKAALFRAAGIDGSEPARVIKRKITEAGLTLYQGLTKKKTPPLPANNGKKPSADEFNNGHVPPSSSRPSRLKGDRAAEQAIHDYFVQNNIRPTNHHEELEGVPD